MNFIDFIKRALQEENGSERAALSFFHVRVLVVLLLGIGPACSSPQATREPEEGHRIEPGLRHVQLIHLDGFRSDVFATLLESGRLPHFEFLLSRGRVSYDAATVDKSETMKVIQSYLTSQLDTEVVGWWQFNRSDFRFRNFWMDPAEVLNYALGLEFPDYPTILDLLDRRGENLVAGMSLARRGVRFENYGRAYLEGARAVYDHTYYRQAHATMERFLDIHERIARSPEEKTPALSVLLLAAADEFSHLHGVTVSEPAPPRSSARHHCFRRDEENADPTVFEVLDDGGEHLERLEGLYFTEVEHAPWSRSHLRLCIELPPVRDVQDVQDVLGVPEGDNPPRVAHPDYVLAMMLIDMELGRLIDRFRSIRFDSQGRRVYQPAETELLSFMTNGPIEDSLFDRTLFILFGDHGMVDTRRMMAPPAPAGPGGSGAASSRDPQSLRVSFLDYLNSALNLESGAGKSGLLTGAEFGIDYESMPERLSMPYRDTSWQSEEIRDVTRQARKWGEDFFEELRVALRANLHESYWWLFFLRSLIIDPRLDQALDPAAEPATDLLVSVYLRGDRDYVDAEIAANRGFFDSRVRLVYGGGARNNAELFFPFCADSSQQACSWEARPSYRQILDYRGGTGSKTTVIDTLKANPGVGLVFIREENDRIHAGRLVPSIMHIRVMDRFSNLGRITAWRDEQTGQLVFRYRVDEGSTEDPLGYGDLGQGEGSVGTYREWNDRSAAPTSEHFYHNAVAGVGSYLYSNNPAIGDVLIVHRRDWNFGENAAGHGGIHAGEKRTLLLVSGPDVAAGALFASQRYQTLPDGTVIASEDGFHYPTILDFTPTALAWLGLPADALEVFAQEGFAEYRRDWNRAQRDDILTQLGGVETVERALEEAGFSDLRIEQFRDRLARLLRFVALSGDDDALAPTHAVDAARVGVAGAALLLSPQNAENR